MVVDQELDRGLNLIRDLSHDSSFVATLHGKELENAVFRFLDLPLELRLKIYQYLLPPRTHTIVTQIPYNGYFYNTSTIPVDSVTSFYPFGRSGPIAPKEGYTTYKVLTTNFRTDFPAFSIHPELFLINKQIHAEAEPMLYGNSNARWDFGVHLDALLAFWGERSEVARKCVKSVRIAREIPFHLSPEYSAVPDPLWSKTCEFIKNHLIGLRTLDLTMWSSTGSDAFSSALWTPNLNSTSSKTDASQMEAESRLRDWEWTSTLLAMPSLKRAKVTWWGFQSSKASDEAGSVKGFDSWIAGRMVGDRLVRDRMIRDGIIVEGVVVVKGLGA